MKTLPVELNVLFNRTLIALETANKSKFAKGKKTDAKIQQFIATQHDFRTWHDFIKSLKEEELTTKQNLTDKIQSVNKLKVLIAQKELIDDLQAVNPNIIEKTECFDDISKMNYKNEKIIFQQIADQAQPHRIFNLDDKELEKGKLLVDIGYKTLDIHRNKETTSTINMQGKSFIVPNSIIEKLSMEEMFDLFSGCYSSQNVRVINEELGLTKISLDHKTRLLNSCEQALESSEEKEMQQWKKEVTIEICGNKIKVDKFVLNSIFQVYGDNELYLAIDKDGGLWAYDKKPVLTTDCESWTCDDYSNFNAMPITQTNIKNYDWKNSVTLIKNT